MKNYETESKIKIEVNKFFSEKELKILLKETKEHFKNKKERGFIDILFYNTLREKPLFSGVDKIRNDKYFITKYQEKFILDAHGTNKLYIDLANKIDGRKERNLTRPIMSKVELLLKKIYREILNNYKKES